MPNLVQITGGSFFFFFWPGAGLTNRVHIRHYDTRVPLLHQVKTPSNGHAISMPLTLFMDLKSAKQPPGAQKKKLRPSSRDNLVFHSRSQHITSTVNGGSRHLKYPGIKL